MTLHSCDGSATSATQQAKNNTNNKDHKHNQQTAKTTRDQTMANARVFNSRGWSPLPDSSGSGGSPIKPVLDGDGKIFVQIASYRDGERCGETLKSLFENADNPDNVVVGLVEQNAPEDKFCIEIFCKSHGFETHTRVTIRKDMTKVSLNEKGLKTCPRYDQIRLVAYHHVQAKGPIYTRSLARKVLGNEEFCMQIDAHTTFVKGWDTLAKEQWMNTENEFGILSNVPADKAQMDEYAVGGAKFTEVPRQCTIRFLDNGFPDYTKPADGKVADLDKPLLGHGWSAAFSFAKCHLEENVPYDTFSLYSMPIEQFSRFARLWTRGYDVYTPTRNIVFHDYGKQPNGHGENEWFKRQRDRFRQASIVRAKTMLQLPGGESDANDQANLGLYGLGKRRSLAQLSDFTNMDLKNKKGNAGPDLKCSGHEWVPYVDKKISPQENLFSNPDNLDPQPEYPLRTKLQYYRQVEPAAPAFEIDLGVDGASGDRRLGPDHFAPDQTTNMPSTSTLFVFWIFGLIVWCIMFQGPSQGGKSQSSSSRKKTGHLYKDV